MSINKELILTLTCLKDVGVKGIGTQRIFTICNSIIEKGINSDSYEDIASMLGAMKEKHFNQITLDNLNDAYKVAKNLISYSETFNIGFITYYDPEYPEILRQTISEDGKSDPPIILWYRGDLSILSMPGLAVIGTREATPEGIKAGKYLSSEFAKRGFNIVSGLAIGCDTCGHLGALDAGGKTTAFLANGLDSDSIYPPENRELAERIVHNGGLLLSEYRIGSNVNRYSLVARDRLQAGLANATLVVQTGIKGGTMHAAKTTLNASKPLFAIKFKDDYVNNHEKCAGNAYLVSKGGKYIKGDDDLNAIAEKIRVWKPETTDFFGLTAL